MPFSRGYHWCEGLIFYIMDKILEHNKIMKELAAEFGDIYFEMFGTCIMNGMDIEIDIYYCWNKLKTEN